MTNGEKLWQGRLPAGGQATPMTYEVNGKQYVVISAGGHGSFGTKMGDYIVAYALPDDANKAKRQRKLPFLCLFLSCGIG
jgi:quinoprotein glucose dehydrogenase